MDRDLIALCLNWPADLRATLGYDASLIARAKRVFNRALQEIEEELEDSATAESQSAKKQKKSAPKKSLDASAPSILQMAMSEGYAGADEEPDQSDDDGETTADKFEKLRKLKGAARTEEIRKYVNDAGEFSLLKFLDKNRDELKPAFILGRRTLADPAGQSVSESTFSIHAAFATDLRRQFSPRVISMMVKLNRNHARLFNRIRAKIWDRYCKKFGKSDTEKEQEPSGEEKKEE